MNRRKNNIAFCHNCGESIHKIEVTIDCPACHTENPMEARFCQGCGQAFTDKGVTKSFFDEQPVEEMEQAFADQFFDFLKQTIHEQQNATSKPRILILRHKSKRN